MKRTIMSQLSASEVMRFALMHPLFLVSFILSCIFLVITIALAFGGLSETWEKRFGKMLIFSSIPVFVWTVFFFKPVFEPVSVTVLGWIAVLGLMGLRKAKDNVNELKYLENSNSWRCPKCKAINELVYIVCKECNEPQPNKKNTDSA